jgi:hypothetical protein
MAERATVHLKHVIGSLAPTAKKDDDVVIVCALRTPIGELSTPRSLQGKARRGSFKDTPADDLLATGA